MKNSKSMNRVSGRTLSWKDALFSSPGPSSPREGAVLFFKGICMGSADIIPGVSGGTIALITGIYEDLLRAIRSADMAMVKQLLSLDVKGALARVHLRFLFCLFLGVGLALVSLARLMNYLLHDFPVPTWSLFFGLIIASILIVGKRIETRGTAQGVSFALGVVAALVIVNLIPVSTPEEAWFIFLSGMIAICAMILPGISGAFILLILGKYAFVTGALKNPFLAENMVIILVFCAGCLTGLVGFSRILNYLLERYHATTLSFLAGLMAGSMWKIWPWKEVVETAVINGKAHVLRDRNIWPGAVDTDLFLALGLALAGFFAVILLERLSKSK